MLDPILIDPKVFAAEGLELKGSANLADFNKRVWSHEYLADKNTQISYSLKGGKDRWQRFYSDLNVSGELLLYCQRCVQPMKFDLNESSHIVLFTDDAALDAAMLSDEELEGMLLEDELDVGALIEDQILMAMPYSPRHENCNNAALETVNQSKSNPFAVLAGLKSSH